MKVKRQRTPTSRYTGIPYLDSRDRRTSRYTGIPYLDSLDRRTSRFYLFICSLHYIITITITPYTTPYYLSRGAARPPHTIPYIIYSALRPATPARPAKYGNSGNRRRSGGNAPVSSACSRVCVDGSNARSVSFTHYK
jgi:hypothetical protein